MDSSNHYLAARRSLTVPAIEALRRQRERTRLETRLAGIGFAWREDRHHRHHRRFAAWTADGFDLRVRIVDDDEGWWTQGESTPGRFIPHWQPGAVRHHKGDRNACGWFLPADPDYAHQDYRRACAHGRDWWYVGVEATASRLGVELGRAALWGIDFDPGGDDDHLTETALELASEAVREAAAKAPFAVRLPLTVNLGLSVTGH